MLKLHLWFSAFCTVASAATLNQAIPRQATECASLTAPAVPDASVVSISAEERRDVPMPQGDATLNYCDVNVTLTHGTANDQVRIEVWLPLEGWNGRFQGTGGGGFVAGTFGLAMAPAVAQGFSAASTDAGVDTSFDGSSASSNGTNAASRSPLSRDEQLLTNFVSLSVHEMAVVGKSLTEAFYGTPAEFSYWNGCSTGGRQGMSEAQAFPEDYNGILAIAPAINWPEFVTAGLWPYAVMNSIGEFPEACIFDALQQATIEACDQLDGARDQLISNPAVCHWDAQLLVGQMVECDGSMTEVTEAQATVYNLMLEGPKSENKTRLWYGFEPGASPTTLASGEPFSLSATWVTDFVMSGQADFNVTALTMESFADVIEQSRNNFEDILGTNDPDLSAFKAAGGKLLTWHGLADQLIFPEGTLDYLKRVQSQMGGPESVDEFYRVFGAPGVQHCAGGTGPEPTEALDSLMAWVEQGQAPDTLPATKTAMNATVNRNLCRFPSSLRYSGSGNINSAESWACTDMPGAQSGIQQGSAMDLAVPRVFAVVSLLAMALWTCL